MSEDKIAEIESKYKENIEDKVSGFIISVPDYQFLLSENAALRATLAEKEKEIEGWHKVVKECELLFGCEDTAESYWQSNLSNLVRDMKAELAEERYENEQLIALRDEYEELVGNVALILGCTDEWSNCHDHRRCIVENATEITHKLADLRNRLKPVEKVWSKWEGITGERELLYNPRVLCRDLWQAIKAACEKKEKMDEI